MRLALFLSFSHSCRPHPSFSLHFVHSWFFFFPTCYPIIIVFSMYLLSLILYIQCSSTKSSHCWFKVIEMKMQKDEEKKIEIRMNCVFTAMMNVLAIVRIDSRGDRFDSASTSNVSLSCATAIIHHWYWVHEIKCAHSQAFYLFFAHKRTNNNKKNEHSRNLSNVWVQKSRMRTEKRICAACRVILILRI